MAFKLVSDSLNGGVELTPEERAAKHKQDQADKIAKHEQERADRTARYKQDQADKIAKYDQSKEDKLAKWAADNPELAKAKEEREERNTSKGSLFGDVIGGVADMNTGDKVDAVLGAAGLTPVWGAVADGVNVVQNLVQSGFNVATGDFDEALHDVENAGWAAAGFIPAGVGQFFTGLKFGKVAAQTAKVNKGVTAKFLNEATEAEIKASKELTQAEKVEVLNARVDVDIAEKASKGKTINGQEYYKGATHYGTVTTKKEQMKIFNQVVDGVGQTGKTLDNSMAKMGFNIATDLKPGNVKLVSKQSGRHIYEVSYPDGSKQKFWRSTGGGQKYVDLPDGSKVSSEGYFGTVAGHMDIDIPGEKNPGWFIKGEGWAGYGSTTFSETGEKLRQLFDSGALGNTPLEYKYGGKPWTPDLK